MDFPLKMHQAKLESWGRTLVSGTLTSVVDGPGYTDITVVGATTVDFTRPLRDSQGKAYRSGYYWSQATYLKVFTADIPGAAGILALSSGLAEADLSLQLRGGPRYDVAADQYSSLAITVGSTGFSALGGVGRVWMDSVMHMSLTPDLTVRPQVACYGRLDDGSTVTRAQFTTGGTVLTDPVQHVRVSVPATGTLRVYAGFAAHQVRVLPKTKTSATTLRRIRARDLVLTAGAGSYADNADGSLELTGYAAGTWKLGLPRMGTIGYDETVLLGVTLGLPPFNFTLGPTDGVNTPYEIGLRPTGGVLTNGGSTTTYATDVGVFDNQYSGHGNPGITYGYALGADGSVLMLRGDSNGALILDDGPLELLYSPVGDGTYRASYWCSGPIPLEIVPRA